MMAEEMNAIAAELEARTARHQSQALQDTVTVAGWQSAIGLLLSAVAVFYLVRALSS